MSEVATLKASPAPPRNGTPWALEHLPPFSPVAMRLVQLLYRENVHIRDVGEFISAEPVFSARVLQIANSPLFALARQVRTISHAVVVIGLERVKGTVNVRLDKLDRRPGALREVPRLSERRRREIKAGHLCAEAGQGGLKGSAQHLGESTTVS